MTNNSENFLGRGGRFAVCSFDVVIACYVSSFILFLSDYPFREDASPSLFVGKEVLEMVEPSTGKECKVLSLVHSLLPFQLPLGRRRGTFWAHFFPFHQTFAPANRTKCTRGMFRFIKFISHLAGNLSSSHGKLFCPQCRPGTFRTSLAFSSAPLPRLPLVFSLAPNPRCLGTKKWLVLYLTLRSGRILRNS